MKETGREADRTETAVGPSTASSTPMVGALVLLAAVQTMVVLDTTIVNVALPTIQSSVGFSASSIAWVVNGYALAFGALLLVGGRSGDLLGRRRVFIASLGAFALASCLGGLSSGPNTLIAARVLQGGAAAFAQASALALIVSTFPAGRPRNRAIGVFAAMEGLGAAAGLLLGGLLVEVASWRWVFFVNVPVAAIVAVLAPRFIPSPARQRSPFDLAGAVAASGGVGLIVFGLSRAADFGWLAPWTIVPAAAGALSLSAFIFIEARSSHPLTPLWVFADRNRSGAYLIQAIMGAALFGMFYLSTLFLQHVLGYSPLKAGAAFIPGSVVTMVAAVVVSKFVARTGVRPLVASGTGIAAVAMLLLSRLSPHSNYLTVLLPMLLLSCGLGLTFVPATIAAVSGVKEQHSGLVSGVSTTAIQLGGSIGLAALATIAAATIRRQPPGTSARQAAAIGYSHAFRFGAIIIALAVPIALATLRLRPGNDHARPAGGPAMAEPPQPVAADAALPFVPDPAHAPVGPSRLNLPDPR